LQTLVVDRCGAFLPCRFRFWVRFCLINF
jgi:hypothetical protein